MMADILDPKTEWLQRVLGVSVMQDAPAEEEDMGPEALGLDVSDMWQAATDAFRSATATVDSQITGLQSALRQETDPELDQIAELGLNALTRNTRVPLMAALMEAGDGSGERLKAAAPKLRKAIDSFRSVLSSDPKIAACDDNPFEVEVTIVETYSEALDQLDDALALV